MRADKSTSHHHSTPQPLGRRSFTFRICDQNPRFNSFLLTILFISIRLCATSGFLRALLAVVITSFSTCARRATALNNGHVMSAQLGQGMENSEREVAPIRKRRRIINSCAGCRKRKSRCDRGQPCSECIANTTVDLCQYLEDAIKPRNSASPVSARSSEPIHTGALQSHDLASHDLASRVTQLENLLRSQMSLLQPQASIPHFERTAVPATPPDTCKYSKLSKRCSLLTNRVVSGSSEKDEGSPALFQSNGRTQGFLQGKNGRGTNPLSARHWASLLYLVRSPCKSADV
jgi:hypothetical protein